MKERETIVNRTPVLKVVKGQQIAGWTIKDDEMNLGIVEDLKVARI